MKIDAGLDTGPVIAERATVITEDDTGGSLTARLSHIGARVVDDTMPAYLTGRRAPVPQIATGSTHAKKLTKSDSQITPDMTVSDALLRLRAFTPRPGPWCATGEGSLKVTGFVPRVNDHAGDPGSIAIINADVVLTVSDGGVVVTGVQLEGKPPVESHAWMNGRRGEPLTFVS
jgi:methionyl-tRNA formyltransferase